MKLAPKEDSAAGEKCKSASTALSPESRWHGEWDGWCRNTSLFIFKTDNFNGAGNAMQRPRRDVLLLRMSLMANIT